MSQNIDLSRRENEPCLSTKKWKIQKQKNWAGGISKEKGIPFPRTRSQFTGAIQTLSNRCRNSRFREKHRNHFEKVKQLKEREDCEGDPRLRPYQRVDLDFLKRLKHCAIFWEMRLGKPRSRFD